MPKIGSINRKTIFTQKPFWTTPDGERCCLYLGDCLKVLKQLPERSVQCCITSPPYFGLRDYGVDGQLGLEKTPQEYVARMVAVFREVRRVLRDDGTLWLNLGDSYAAHPGQRKTTDKVGEKQASNAGSNTAPSRYVADLKAKDLIGIPWRVAFALQEDGWYLRQDIIWHKPNPMPESVTDRCTKAHEYLFLLSKSARYFFDAEAIAEVTQDVASIGRRSSVNGMGNGQLAKSARFGSSETRNRRSVWTVATQPYPGAHFATFPTELIRPMVLAGTSERGACVRCGSPWRRIVKTDNWEATCRCRDGVGVRPCVVLDPFVGSGTTCMVALEEGRSAWGVELSEKYLTENAIVRITSPKKRSKRQLRPPEGVPRT